MLEFVEKYWVQGLSSLQEKCLFSPEVPALLESEGVGCLMTLAIAEGVPHGPVQWFQPLLVVTDTCHYLTKDIFLFGSKPWLELFKQE